MYLAAVDKNNIHQCGNGWKMKTQYKRRSNILLQARGMLKHNKSAVKVYLIPDYIQKLCEADSIMWFDYVSRKGVLLVERPEHFGLPKNGTGAGKEARK